MNDFHMTHLAQDRRRDLEREAAAARLARGAGTHPDHRGAAHPSSTRPRSALRLTLDFVLGRAAA